jgi:hypothetical protein
VITLRDRRAGIFFANTGEVLKGGLMSKSIAAERSIEFVAIRQPPSLEEQTANRRRQPIRSQRAFSLGLFISRVFAVFFTAATIAALLFGWKMRDENYLSPETGLGYWLGIAGATSMMLLLLYPVRKRVQWMRTFGSVKFWFRVHMMLGIIGPVLILYHANFKLGSTNSNIALITMLVVATSGLVGRYLYGKVHRSFDGRKSEIESLVADVRSQIAQFGEESPLTAQFAEDLTVFADRSLRPASSAIAGIWNFILFGLRASEFRRRLSAAIKSVVEKEAAQQKWSRSQRRNSRKSVDKFLAEYEACVRSAVTFKAFERMFALWHVLHLPLFILLILAATLHIAAVHIY